MNLVPSIPSTGTPEHYVEPSAYPHAPGEDNAKIFLIDILAAIHRNRRLALTVGGLAVVAVLAVTFFVTPMYQSTATIMLDTRHEQVVDLQAVLSNLPSDTFVVDSEVQVLQSPALAHRVIKKLNLENDPEFNASLRAPTIIGWTVGTAKSALHTALAWFGAEPASDVDSKDRTLESVTEAFEKNLTINRQGLTYVITVGFWSQDPAKAVRIANAVANTYIEQQKDLKAAATRQANVLIAKHVAELKQEVRKAEQAVADYKTKHGLLNAVGAPLTEQEISALNTQLAAAQAQQAEEEGKLAADMSQYRQGGTGAVGQAAMSDTVRELRSQQAQLLQQYADLSKRYGPKHPDLVKVHNQLAAIDGAISAEVTRIISQQKEMTAAAQQRAASLAASIARDRQTLALNNTAGVKLAELQRDADAVRGVYESFLTRLKQTDAQEDIQDADAQVISPATIPLKPSSPSWLLAAAAALLFGAFASGCAIVLREFMDRGVRTPDDAESATGVPVISIVPRIAKADPVSYVVKRPMSDFAEAIRNLRTSLFLSRAGTPPKVVAMMSALPHEGKTTTTLALGRQAAESGSRVVIVDADLRQCTLSSYLRVPPRAGLVELLEGTATLESCLYRDPMSSAMILPVSATDGAGRDIFFNHDLGRIFDQLRQRFDIVLVDTAPLLPLAEPRLVASHADSVVMLTRWHKTPRSAMQEAARLIRTLDVPVAGMALTCADMKLLDSFGYAARSYGQRAIYANYYIT
ncbi:MAG TPA: Wzz/FepE/Etk N-terminal domain-containing protein [Rhizomicrobium sp.]|nr:Wzz/FepE/Etk N-terminal domain-containing protein [Rhizomicrobium sp.]